MHFNRRHIMPVCVFHTKPFSVVHEQFYLNYDASSHVRIDEAIDVTIGGNRKFVSTPCSPS